MWLPAESRWVLLWPGIVLWGIILAAVIGVLKRKPFGWMASAFLLILAPTSSLMPLPDPAVEHRMYLPLAVVMAALLIGGYASMEYVLKSRIRWRRLVVFLAGGVCLMGVVIFGRMTYLRNLDYLSEYRMWQDVLEKRPDNWRGYLAVSKSLLLRGEFQQAIDLIEGFKKRIPDYASFSDAEVEALKVAPARDRVRSTFFSMIENNLGVAKSQLGRVDEALTHYKTVLRFVPDDTDANNNIGYELYLRGATNEAVRYWFAALNTDANNGPAHCFLGMIYEDRHEWAKAIKHYQVVLMVNPGLVAYQYRLAWLLATVEDAHLRDSSQALALVQSVMRATDGKSAKAWDLMGIIWAEQGDFKRALDCVAKALELLALDSSKTQQANLSQTDKKRDSLKRSDVEDRRKLYLERKPFYVRDVSIPTSINENEMTDH
jgi:tetratricopeptide (TPR) repeat protein